MNVSSIIEYHIKEHGFNKNSLSEKIGIARQNFNAMIKSPSYPTLVKISDALGISVAQLLTSHEEIENKNYIVCPHCGKRINIEKG